MENDSEPSLCFEEKVEFAESSKGSLSFIVLCVRWGVCIYESRSITPVTTALQRRLPSNEQSIAGQQA
jgi:hypothetical protein